MKNIKRIKGFIDEWFKPVGAAIVIAYIAFSQYVIISVINKPGDVTVTYIETAVSNQMEDERQEMDALLAAYQMGIAAELTKFANQVGAFSQEVTKIQAANLVQAKEIRGIKQDQIIIRAAQAQLLDAVFKERGDARF